MWINEIYFDPPGSAGDLAFEYVELRGTPNASLADTYLVLLENEKSATANAGLIDFYFDLGALSTPALGSNGFLVLRQAANAYSSVAAGATDLVNTGTAFGWGTNAATTVGVHVEGDTGRIENSGFTALLVKNNGGAASAPALGIDLDVENDAVLDVPTGRAGWEILDSIGINSEAAEENGILYGAINYSIGSPVEGPHVAPGVLFIETGFEIEYVGRWGNSTGSTAADWHATNLTNDELSGYAGPDDFRQSGDPHGIGIANQTVESSQGVPYGTILTNTLGSENLFIEDGDYVIDGAVDGADFLLWQRNLGFGGGQYATREHGDADLDHTVDADDLALWQMHYGAGGTPATAALQAVPEPAAWSLAFAVAWAGRIAVRRRGR